MRRSALTYGFATALALWVIAPAATVQAQPRYALQPESTVRIAGTATTGDFSCEASDLVGHGRFPRGAEGDGAKAELAVRVRSFDCGKRRMNADLYDALRSIEHPLIRFTLTDVKVEAAPAEAGAGGLQAGGRLTLAGTTRPVTVALAGRVGPDGRLCGQGQKALRMSDFGVEPPTALLGLIKVRDRLTVHFDLVAAPADAAATSH